jgi:ribosomal subunit interface protein
MLELQVKSTDIPLTPEIDAYIRERAARLDEFHPSILTCRAIVDAPVGHHRLGGPYRVRIDLDVPGTVIAVTRRSAEDLHVAIRTAFDAAERRLGAYTKRHRGRPPVEERPLRATVARMFPDEGYGFLLAPAGHEVYFHRNSVLAPGFDSLAVGSEVRYAEEPGDRGPQATTVAPAGAQRH